ncbi:Y2E7 [Enterospora canceri]|uniref:PRA1 family protein n=1 Tax=Enterospora canceri TaxID=1081671 RepID=A0A1Y1S552_9MICR|nr:Y2E7 [Enterospora canceri]
METGAFTETAYDNEPSTVLDYLKNKYYEKPDIGEFIDFRRPADYSFDKMTENTKKNFDRFAVYYIGITALLYALFILSSPMFIIPFGLIATAIYFVNTQTVINGVEITSRQAIIGCLVANAVLFLCFKSYFAHRIVYFFSINALCVLMVVVHSQFVMEKNDEEDKL